MRARAFFICLVGLLFILPANVSAVTNVTWDPGSITQTLMVGESTTFSVSFKSSISLENPELFITPELEPFVSTSRIKSISANKWYKIKLTLTAPPDIDDLGSYDGTIHLRDAINTLPDTLKINLTILKAVGMEGGNLEFRNGVILEIPPGAVTEDVNINVTELPFDEIDAILSAKEHVSPKGHCIWAYAFEPDGLEFNVPIKAIFPTAPILPGEVPVQIEIDLSKQKYWPAPTDLTYRMNEGIVEIYNIQHFSTIAGEKIELDEDYVPPDPCCSVYPTPVDCCCTTFHAEYQGGDFSSGDCQIVGEDLTLTYTECDGSPTWSMHLGALSDGCEDMKIEGKITPENPIIDICEETSFLAQIIGKDEEGNVKFTGEMPATWTITPQANIAEFTNISPLGQSTVLGLKEGAVVVKASSPGTDVFGQTILEVKKPNLDIIPHSGSFHMEVDDVDVWDVLCTTCPDGDIFWENDSPETVALNVLSEDTVSVKALKRGVAHITTKFICGVPEPVEYITTVVVEQEVDKVVLFPETETIEEGQTLPLIVMVYDKNGNEIEEYDDPVWTIPVGGKISFDPINQIVKGESVGTAVIKATVEGVDGTATITVGPGNPIYHLTWSWSYTDDWSPDIVEYYYFSGSVYIELRYIEEYGGYYIFDYRNDWFEIEDISATGKFYQPDNLCTPWTEFHDETPLDSEWFLSHYPVFGIREDPAGGWNFTFGFFNVNMMDDLIGWSSSCYDVIDKICEPCGGSNIWWFTDFGTCQDVSGNWPGTIDCSALTRMHSDDKEHFVLHDTREYIPNVYSVQTFTWDIDIVKQP
jgi:hypothetical protein